MKTLTLENYGVVELPQSESTSLDGGMTWDQVVDKINSMLNSSSSGGGFFCNLCDDSSCDNWSYTPR